jgi:hypothetical protein
VIYVTTKNRFNTKGQIPIRVIGPHCASGSGRFRNVQCERPFPFGTGERRSDK